MTEITAQDARHQTVYRAAHEIYQRNPDWVQFFREVLGVNGVVRRHYPTPEDLVEFEATEAYTAIQHMLAKLRQQSGDATKTPEPTCVITVRLPRSLHDAIRSEAFEHKTSMNKLCISKLIRIIDSELVPKADIG